MHFNMKMETNISYDDKFIYIEGFFRKNPFEELLHKLSGIKIF